MSEKHDKWAGVVICLFLVSLGMLLLSSYSRSVFNSIMGNQAFQAITLGLSSLAVLAVLAWGIFELAKFTIKSLSSIYLHKKLETHLAQGAKLDAKSLKELEALIMLRNQGHYRVPFKFKVACFGMLLIFSGVLLLKISFLGSDFLGAFISVTGAQIFLWAIGIRLEILANASSQFVTQVNKESNDSATS